VANGQVEHRVRSNIEFALECKNVPKSGRFAAVGRLIEQIGLQHRANAYPFELSGGMKQRVAIARALAYDADVLLMDEPFGALDAQTKLTMQSLLLDIWQTSRKTVLFVTHDIDEAIYLADRVVIMTRGPGRINAEIAVNAGRPRSREFLVSDLFLSMKRKVFNVINDAEHENGNGVAN
jgi:NitT/TauT family transport system ATP-binding protein